MAIQHRAIEFQRQIQRGLQGLQHRRQRIRCCRTKGDQLGLRTGQRRQLSGHALQNFGFGACQVVLRLLTQLLLQACCQRVVQALRKQAAW